MQMRAQLQLRNRIHFSSKKGINVSLILQWMVFNYLALLAIKELLKTMKNSLKELLE
jgi:hypothetical protein